MIIFDFDQTLVDTHPVEHLRAKRMWNGVMQRAPDLEVYDGVHELLNELHEKNQKLAIVTHSPDMIPRKFVELYNWPVKIVLGPHQIKKRKPDPRGLLMAMEKGGAVAENTFHIGDKPEDTEASQAAGVTAVGAGWGSLDAEALKASNPDHLFTAVSDLREFLLGAV